MSAEANVAVPRARWIVTTAGSFPDVIVTAPTATWVTRIAKLMKDSVPSRRSGRNQRIANTMVKRMERLVSAAASRCAYSTATVGSRRSGMADPLQRGQSGHASPAPIPRTVPPRTIVAYALRVPKIATTCTSRRRSIFVEFPLAREAARR